MKPTLFALFLIPVFAQAQNHTLYLKNGEKIEAQTIRYRNPIFGKERLILGEKKYFMDQLDSFRIFKISYLSKQIRGKGRYISVRSVIRGKINLYDHSRPPKTETIASLIPEKLVVGLAMLEHYDHPINFYRHRKLVQIIQNDEQALSAFRPARKIYTIQMIKRGTTLGLFVAALSVNPAYFATTGEGLLYGALTLSMASDIHGILSSEQYFASANDAIKIYNQKFGSD